MKDPASGLSVPAVFTVTLADSTAGLLKGITMFVDYTGNDNATDAGEQVNIVDLNSSRPAWWTSTEYINDLEIVKGDDGTLFLLVDALWSGGGWGQTLSVLRLGDNGLFSGDWANDAKVIAYYGYGSGYSVPKMIGLYGFFEFDATAATVVPEPGTLLLMGTGVLGVVGWMRRRRMR